MERRKFEESLKAAFDQAEVSPSENAWINIELQLERAKGNKLRRRLLFYQMLAAASVVFAMGMSVYVLRPGAGQQNLAFREAVKLNGAAQQTPVATDRSSQPEYEAPATSQALATDESGQADKQSTSETNQHQNTGAVIAGRASEVPPVPGNTAQALKKMPDGNKANDGRYLDNSSADAMTNANPAIAAVNQGDVVQTVDNSNAANDSNSTHAVTSVGGERGNVGATVPPANFSAAMPLPATASEGAYTLAVFSSIAERKLPPLTDHRQTGVALLPKKQEADPVALMMARLEKREQEVREASKEKKDDSNDEKLWTSIGVAAGSFNSVNTKGPDLMSSSALSTADGLGALASANASQSAADKEIKASGISYSMGINIGTRLSKRWVFQGGLNYLTQSSDHTQNSMLGDENFTSFRPQSMKDVDKMTTTEGALSDELRNSVNTEPYNVNNNTRYLSVPMQAGYLIINRAFGFQLNAGVATDLFLQNTITATVDGETVDKSTEQSGNNSSFRQFNLSGLMGTELSYKFNRHYRISLNPGVRYPFGNIYKSDDYRATRLSFDVGLRFRYIFH